MKFQSVIKRRNIKASQLPNLHMYDYFAEINFILSNPQVGETRAISFDLDFENEVFGCNPTLNKSKRFRW